VERPSEELRFKDDHFYAITAMRCQQTVMNCVRLILHRLSRQVPNVDKVGPLLNSTMSVLDVAHEGTLRALTVGC
jgi:hypothetical protein